MTKTRARTSSAQAKPRQRAPKKKDVRSAKASTKPARQRQTDRVPSPAPVSHGRRLRDDAVLSLTAVDAASVSGCRAMFRYAYDTLAAIHEPITFADLVVRVEADAEYQRRSHQPVRRHLRQLVAKLRQWGLVEASAPTPTATSPQASADRPSRGRRGRR